MRTCSRAALGVLLSSACLVPNPAFVEATASSSTEAASSGSQTDDATSETTEGATSETTEGATSETTEGATSETTEGAACEPDAYEPNDGELTPSLLGSVNDEALPLFIQGVLESPASEDWFRFDGDDQSLLPPVIMLDAGATDGLELGLCVFVACVQGTIDENHLCSGQDAMHAHTIDSYLHGCCATGAVSFSTQCLGAPDNDMTVWLRVAASAPSLQACVDYVFQYTF